jgi:hypothetical protein
MHTLVRCSACALALVSGTTGCDWYGAHTDRQLGDSTKLGGWTVEIRRSMSNTGILKRSENDAWIVATKIVFIDGDKARFPKGPPRGLCGSVWSYPKMSKADARAGAKADYEREPSIDTCQDDDAGILVAACLEGESDPPEWLVVIASPEGLAFGENVRAPGCADALRIAVESHEPAKDAPPRIAK